jgi:glycosyltransferase involved in cell wall biosynthesis
MYTGGIETSLIELLNKINYEKYDVTLFLEEKKGELLSKINQNVKIYNYNLSNSKHVIIRKIKNGFNRLKFLLFNKNKYDFSICYATYSKPCSMLSLKASKNTAIYIHGDYVVEFNDRIRTINFFENQDIYSFKNIIFVSNESKDNLINIMPRIKDKSVVINNFINYDRVLSLSNEEIKESKPNKKLLLYVGRLDEEVKKISRMINAVEYLKKNNIDVEFWIVGDGKDYKYYKDKIKQKNLEENIKMLGLKENPYPYIKLCDYLVITSDHEGFPVTFLEALVLNKKIISTISVSDEEVNIKDYGYIISKNQNKLNKELLEILSKNNKKNKKINFNKIEKDRIKKLEKMIEGD